MSSGRSFIAVGIAFLVLGLSGRQPFLVLGLVFLAVGFARQRRQKPS